MNPWMLLAGAIALVGSFIAGNIHGTKTERTAWEAKTYHELADASEAARSQEAMWQGVVNETFRNGEKRKAAIERRLTSELDSLRNRPERPADVSEAPRATCEGANGAELAGSHAEFLARFSAIAARQDSALADCYAVLDGIQPRCNRETVSPCSRR